jgi:hypothetical protein
MRDGPEAGLVLIAPLLDQGGLGHYRFAHAARPRPRSLNGTTPIAQIWAPVMEGATVAFLT